MAKSRREKRWVLIDGRGEYVASKAHYDAFGIETTRDPRRARRWNTRAGAEAARDERGFYGHSAIKR